MQRLDPNRRQKLERKISDEALKAFSERYPEASPGQFDVTPFPDLLRRMLSWDESERPGFDECLKHELWAAGSGVIEVAGDGEEAEDDWESQRALVAELRRRREALKQEKRDLAEREAVSYLISKSFQNDGRIPCPFGGSGAQKGLDTRSTLP